ncbi:hypothetical protein ACL2XP_17150 [Sodalis sp. RH21]|uniref:hypothetical protein n=1 Tax=unclassified Sodalis (in: enterobacteria) TaxID=2636512 RepID=UPI0039B55CA6
MCQLNVRLVFIDKQEERVSEVTHMAVMPGKITLSSLFAPPRDLIGFQVTEIDCLRSLVVVEQLAPA